jgi:NAD-dependent deacetylase
MTERDTDALHRLIRDALGSSRQLVVLTGAGISAESGIPTFRGQEGYWTVGSTEYHPQELATSAAFRRMPWAVWAWYLYRRGVCRAAAPNDAHRALVRAEAALGDRFVLITQNVDGLHRRAGSSPERTYEIHGNIELARCADDCSADRFPIPAGVPDLARGEDLGDEARGLLICPRCGAMARPHVLWFDERYDEERFRWDSSERAARAASLLIVIGTSARTSLPWVVVETASESGATIVDINVEDNPFGDIAARHGAAVRAPAAQVLPGLVDALLTS